MIQSAALLFRERGVDGTAFADVLDHAEAPRGSVYHHFPGGKDQLAVEATRYGGEFIARVIEKEIAGGDPVGALHAFVGTWIQVLEDSDFAAGCPIAAAALEGERSPDVRDAAGSIFAGWQRLIADALEVEDVTPDRASAIATLTIASIEGAVMIARAERSIEPLQRVADELGRLVGGDLGAPPDGKF